MSEKKKNVLEKLEIKYRSIIDGLPEEWENMPAGVVLDTLEKNS
ncbi:hypothetical protein THOM_0478 [Trachipleistophora hominis]|uniref:Uncharacterized protein n=1 Tax=Trachipleistophora hominis TaxID=72359 RepID=L7JYY3_TRAHO|nr:hypothetical protein THOM_0478 [Trachipleistophora hominis]